MRRIKDVWDTVMIKRVATKRTVKSKGKVVSHEAISWTQDSLDPELLGIPEDFIREEIAFWSWFDSPEGDLWQRMSTELKTPLADVTVDARQRRFLWAGSKPKSLDQTVRRIRRQYRHFTEQDVKQFLAHWIVYIYVPDNYSKSQMREFEILTQLWAKEICPESD